MEPLFICNSLGRIFTFLIVIFTLIGCSTGRIVDLKQDLDYELLESVFLYQFKNNGSSLKESADKYCLYVRDHSLDTTFFNRFEGHSPQVFPLDKCDDIDKRLAFSIREIRKISNSKYHVFGGYSEGLLSSSGNRYTVIRNSDGTWRVVGRKLIWVS